MTNDRPETSELTTQTFTKKDLIADPDRVLAAANISGKAVVLGDDGAPELIVSVLQRGLDP